MVIATPGIYDKVPASVYHSDCCPEPSLSASIAKLLCNASPAHAFQAHPRLNPATVAENGEHFDLGTAAHALLLEGQASVTVIDAPDFRTKAAREARDAAYAAGRTPLLAGKWADVQAMVAAARGQLDRHTDGGADMFTNGQPEQTLIWREGPTWCRARLDWLRPGGIDDYKTTPHSTANPEHWSRSIFGMGFDIQAAFYLRGLKALTGYDAIFRFAVQEPYPPYALSVIGLSPDTLLLGEKKVITALEMWRECLEANEWPGYPRRTCYATLPAWEEARWLEKELR
jgi:hypothetical protein